MLAVLVRKAATVELALQLLALEAVEQARMAATLLAVLVATAVQAVAAALLDLLSLALAVQEEAPVELAALVAEGHPVLVVRPILVAVVALLSLVVPAL